MEQNSRWVVALARPEANAGSAGARAGAQLAPGAPAAVLPHLVGVLPHAVTFVAPLETQRRSKKGKLNQTHKKLNSIEQI